MYNYFAMALASTIGIVFFDDDPTSVSIQEWVLYAVLLYSAIGFLRIYFELVSRRNGQ